MASGSKQAGTITLGGVLIVAVVIGSKLLGGPDLAALLTSETQTSGDSQRSAHTEPAPRHLAPEPKQQPAPAAAETAPDESAIRALIDSETSGEMVELHAEIVKILPDDNDGSRHQRLLLALESGGTVLVAHNIDLAERVPADEGDWVTVFGQYEWNDRGGVLHWTHHDPKGWREGGWIEHDGARYE